MADSPRTLNYGITEYAYDGRTVKAGQIFRHAKDTGPFGDCLVLGIAEDSKRNVYVRLIRPYAYAHAIGGPTPLLGYETVEVDINRFFSNFVLVDAFPRTL
jgi:hypothetical protein